MNYIQYMESRLQQPVSFSIRKAFSDGFSYLGKNIGMYVGYTLVYGMIMLIAYGISAIIPFNIGGYIVHILLSQALVMGYALFCHAYIVNNTADFSEFFAGFRKNYTQLVVANLVLTVVIGITYALLILPFSQELSATYESLLYNGADPEIVFQEVAAIASENIWPMPAYYVITVVIQITYLLTNYFIVFFDFGFWEALEASRRLMSRVFFKTFVYFLLLGFVLLFGGVFTIGIGLLFFFPATMLMSYSIFEQVAGFEVPEPSLEDDLII